MSSPSYAPLSFFLFTLVAGPRGTLSLELGDTAVYAPQIRALLGNHNSCTCQTLHVLCHVISIPQGRTARSYLLQSRGASQGYLDHEKQHPRKPCCQLRPPSSPPTPSVRTVSGRARLGRERKSHLCRLRMLVYFGLDPSSLCRGERVPHAAAGCWGVKGLRTRHTLEPLVWH